MDTYVAQMTRQQIENNIDNIIKNYRGRNLLIGNTDVLQTTTLLPAYIEFKICENIAPGTIVSFSADVTVGQANPNARIYLYQGDGIKLTYVSNYSEINKTGKVKYTFTFNGNPSGGSGNGILRITGSVDILLSVKNVKLEYGSIVTPYCHADEDYLLMKNYQKEIIYFDKTSNISPTLSNNNPPSIFTEANVIYDSRNFFYYAVNTGSGMLINETYYRTWNGYKEYGELANSTAAQYTNVVVPHYNKIYIDKSTLKIYTSCNGKLELLSTASALAFEKV